jgi:hypothetical protein
LEELKCLFLRARNPPKRAFEELIRKIIKCDLNSAEGIEWLQTANRHFGDFRNKFVNSIEDLVKNFKEARTMFVSLFYFYFLLQSITILFLLLIDRVLYRKKR